ncbi:hypothetical protein O5D80_008267 [Batrachochytrium dendrobatidis]|nr:hypothetical protein O5D80_008267 [Batrachochytrium dendrobatidis]
MPNRFGPPYYPTTWLDNGQTVNGMLTIAGYNLHGKIAYTPEKISLNSKVMGRLLGLSVSSSNKPSSSISSSSVESGSSASISLGAGSSS